MLAGTPTERGANVDDFALSPQLRAVQQIKEIAWGMVSTSAVVAAIRLGIPEMLGEEPRSADSLAAQIGANPGTLARLLDTLECRGVFERLPDGRHQHNELSRLLRDDDPNSVTYLVRWIGA